MQSSEGLDALLDEALEEFETSLPAKPSAPSPGPSEVRDRADAEAGPSAVPGAEPGPSTSAAAAATTASAPPAAAAAAPLPPPRPAGKGLAFNPLGPRPPPPRRGSAAAAGAGPSTATAPAPPQQQQQQQRAEGLVGDSDEEEDVGGAAEALRAAAAAAGLEDLGDMDDLSAGLSKLLAELANVDDETLAQAAADLAASAGTQSTAQQGAQRGPQQTQQAQQGDLASTLRALAEQAPSFGAEGGGNEDPLSQLGAHPEMASLVDSIMQQLLSKDVLYQPMKDIGERYPAWLEANRGSLSPEDLARYSRQYEYIQQICALYEASPGDYAQLVNLLQQMQQCGQPPQEIVDELAPGMQFDPEGVPRFPGGSGGAGGDLPPELAECCLM